MSALETTSAANVKIQLWEKLELECGKDKNTGLYFARVQDISREGLVIDRPVWLSGEPTFNEREGFLVTILREDGAYRFQGSIIRSFKKAGKIQYLLRHPQRLHRFQRRAYVRVEHVTNVHFIVLNQVLEGQVEFAQAKEYAASSVNISASGILINTLKVIEPDDFVALELKDKALGLEFPIVGIVRRINDEENNRITAGIEFISAEDLEYKLPAEQLKRLPKSFLCFSERKRQGLVQFIFNYQVKLRQKGLI